MSFTEREKAAQTALRHLNKALYKNLSADIRVDLYGKDILTWSENERIGMLPKTWWLESDGLPWLSPSPLNTDNLNCSLEFTTSL